jgi:hypothetical protein
VRHICLIGSTRRPSPASAYLQKELWSSSENRCIKACASSCRRSTRLRKSPNFALTTKPKHLNLVLATRPWEVPGCALYLRSLAVLLVTKRCLS